MKQFIFILGIFILSGCTPLEAGRTVWGSSTRILENERIHAITAAYNCSIDDCYDSILEMGADKGEEESVSLRNIRRGYSSASAEPEPTAQGKTPVSDRPFRIFLQDRIKSCLIVINVPENIDTTEVGIFLAYEEKGIRVEISSLSTTAKRKVAETVFNELDKKYKRMR